jgi:hypothetical protein
MRIRAGRSPLKSACMFPAMNRLQASDTDLEQ